MSMAISVERGKELGLANWQSLIASFLLAIALPLVFFPSALLPFGFLLILSWYLWRWMWFKSPIPVTHINPFLLVLLFMLTLGLRFAPNGEYSTVTVGHVLAGVTLFF